jgi:ribosomal protein L11 methyltransferase
MDWLEVSITVTAEAEETVADWLAQFAPDGVSSEAAHVEITSEALGVARPVGPVTLRIYLPEDETLEARRAEVEAALSQLAPELVVAAPRFTLVSSVYWAESWKVHFQPVRVGRRLMVVPAWLNPPLAPDDVPLRLDPGMAFGTGTHPTTQLCLAAVEAYLQPGRALLDLGTGSGILSIAAAKLSAGPILALDVDAEAVRVARENVAANGVADQIRVETGSLAEVLAGQYGQVEFPLVVANILPSVLLSFFETGLARCAAPGGVIIVSGILDSQAADVRAAAERQGLQFVAQNQIEAWVALVVRRPQGQPVN